MSKLYLDVDGVILTKRHIRPVDNISKLLDYVLSAFDCYWLTTHCRDGNAEGLIKMLSSYYHSAMIAKFRRIKPTTWDALKTEAIDFNTDFYWLDDYVLEAEKKVLRQHECLEKLIVVDIDRFGEIERLIRYMS